MRKISRLNRHAIFLMAWILGAGTAGFIPGARAAGSSPPQESTSSRQAASEEKPEPKPQLDRSGRKRVGAASFYAQKFAGKKMADGAPMDPQGDNAASKTLPLGTTAKVTNLGTGRSAVVTIQDRGPYVKGRIVDLSPSTARKIGITQDQGVARVTVVPIAVPLADGSVKPGDAAQDAKAGKPAPGDRGK
jgi:rare lipoprotein A